MITGTTTLAGTNLITNTYDLADQLTGTASTQGNTTYSYDGNGNQTASYGITGIVTNTYNDLDQLTNVVGPGTNVSYVYDGQGARLRSYEQSGTTPVLSNDAQDLAGGLSDLVSDGTNDYTYLDPGAGEAPTAAYTVGTSRTTYLASDVLGSVRLATDPTGAVIGAGAYDAWGVYQPNTGANGATQLAGLQAVSPFGYAGQYYDAGAGTYDMRAREYNPAQGRFLNEDPQSFDPQVPVTINPYEYAGDMVTGTTDPSGQGWTAYLSPTLNEDPLYEYTIAQGLGLTDQSTSRIDALIHPPAQDCSHGTSTYVANLIKADSNASATNPTSGQVWDMEHVQAFRAPGAPLAIAQGIQTHLIAGAQNGIVDWVMGNGCGGAYYSSTRPCSGRVTGLPLQLRPGEDFLSAFGVQGGASPIAGGQLALILPVYQDGSKVIVAWSGGPGLILYDVFPKAPPCAAAKGWEKLGCAANNVAEQLIGTPFGVVISDPNWLHKGIAAVGLISLGGGLLNGVTRAAGNGGRVLGIFGDADAILKLSDDDAQKVIQDVTGDTAAAASYSEAETNLAEVGSGEPWTGTGPEPQWGNPKSTKAYGHSLSDHGPKLDPKNLAGQAKSLETDQGQWLDENGPVEAEQLAPKRPGVFVVSMGRVVGKVYLPDGTVVDATKVFVKRRTNGTIATSFPVTDDYTP